MRKFNDKDAWGKEQNDDINWQKEWKFVTCESHS